MCRSQATTRGPSLSYNVCASVRNVGAGDQVTTLKGTVNQRLHVQKNPRVEGRLIRNPTSIGHFQAIPPKHQRRP